MSLLKIIPLIALLFFLIFCAGLKPGGGGGSRKKWSNQLNQIFVWKGGFEVYRSVYTQKGWLNPPTS